MSAAPPSEDPVTARAEALHLVADISNSTTKLALVGEGLRFLAQARVPTPHLSKDSLLELTKAWPLQRVPVTVASVVPAKTVAFREAFPGVPQIAVSASLDLGFAIRYPRPAEIGADRLANVAACLALHRAPAVVVDCGTAVTFDVIDSAGAYLGGAIAPGLRLAADYLHEKTALLPSVALAEPERAVGQSTTEAMLIGIVTGGRGMVKAIIDAVCREEFPQTKPLLVATGGDAQFLAAGLPQFDVVDPLLTLRGVAMLATRLHGTE